MPDSEKKTAVGVCEEIVEKNGWTAFHINVGSKYPVRLSTKLEKLIEEGRAVGNQTATWHYKEVESETINENTGKPFVNRYMEKVEVGGIDVPVETAAQPAQRPAEAQHEPVAIGDKERVIARLACLKAAAMLYTGKGDFGKIVEDGPDAVSAVIQAAQRFEVSVYRDIDELPF